MDAQEENHCMFVNRSYSVFRTPFSALAADVTLGSTLEAQIKETTAGNTGDAAVGTTESITSNPYDSESVSGITSEDVSEFTSEFIEEDMVWETSEELPEGTLIMRKEKQNRKSPFAGTAGDFK